MSESLMLRKRDAKARPHLAQYAPVWLVDQQIFPEDEAVQFNVVFQHNLYGWVNRRYRYDAFNDVLYHKGQTVLSEEEALQIQEQEPYLVPTVTDIPNAYGG
ncbi:hypothetical protein FBR02_11205 [Anaerolineae bacterium CFX9]|jgi:hypothetical protein|nr:hypothetical protein [Kamptonema cortianum]MDL1901328.1 hypothetical protein [Anaerolineae bacterium CFX9]